MRRQGKEMRRWGDEEMRSGRFLLLVTKLLLGNASLEAPASRDSRSRKQELPQQGYKVGTL
jgi:predicted lysophospholipase L1 biosynthesis ABC-type transport system permease subunit